MRLRPLAAAVAVAGSLAAACSGAPEHDSRKAVEMSATVTSLRIVDTKVGAGTEAVPGREVTVHYTGTLLDGHKFDSSRDTGRPFTFRLGVREVIAGWDEGIKGMRVGGTRRLTIPSSMAYATRGFPPDIPPNAALEFDVELLDVK
jgi:FKBP-type peptidyl-prolyl cis-trans isomerase